MLSHPVLAAADAIDEALKDVRDVDPAFMSTIDKERALVELTALGDRLEELRLRVLASAADVADEHGARDAGSWIAHRMRGTRGAGRSHQCLAAQLDVHVPVRTALADGRLRVAQATEIVRALDALPADVDASVRAAAREHLVELAADHDAKALRLLGRRVLDVVAPEVGEAQEAARLEREAQRAARTASFQMRDDGQGRCHGRFVIPTVAGAMLRQHLLALANPRRHDEADLVDPDTGTWRSTPERLGAAFVEYVERYPVDRTPSSGGVAATVVVTMSLDTLTGGLAAASLDSGLHISAGEARRLACEAAVVPAVLGSDSQPLDLGRKVRLHSGPQRIALGLRDGGCTAQGCDLPPSACHAHHDRPWSRGGPTTLADGRLLCPRHHRLAHRPDYDLHRHPDNSVTFHRRV